MSRRLVQRFVLLLVVLTGSSAWMAGQNSTARRFRRAEPPDFLDAKPSDIFFQDAFAEALRGTRPAGLGRPPTPPATGGTPSNGEDADPTTGGYAWSKIISAATIEDEIKLIRQVIDQTVTTPQEYRDGGFQKGRIQFSMLALLFAIVHDYDDDIRWKKDAGHARDRFARAGVNSKVGSLPAYKEADKCKADLGELVRGAGLSVSGPAQPNAWDQIVERAPLMKRFKLAYHERISAWTADTNSFRKHAEEILREAELVAAMAAAIHQEGFDLADDEGYVGYCQQLQQAASSVADAARRNDAPAGRQAAGKMAQACNDCHGDYR